MSFGFNRTRAPSVRNYEEALYIFNNTQPIRGRATDTRPFVTRRDDNRLVYMKADNSVALKLYSTDVMVFHKGKPIEITVNGFATQSTTAFLNDVLGSEKLSFCLFDGRIWAGTLDGYYPLPSGEPTHISRNADGVHCVLDKPMFPVVHYVDRKGANIVRRNYKPFRDYVTRMLKLRGNCVLQHEFGEAFGYFDNPHRARPLPPRLPKALEVRLWGKPHPQVLAEFFRLCLSTEPQDNNKAFLWLSVGAMRKVLLDGQTPNVATETMMQHLSSLILLHHKHECFIQKVITDGRLVKDNYEAYFN